jgi:hypothetical protein
MILNLLERLRSSSELLLKFQLPERIGSIKNLFNNPLLLPFDKGQSKGKLSIFMLTQLQKKSMKKSLCRD